MSYPDRKNKAFHATSDDPGFMSGEDKAKLDTFPDTYSALSGPTFGIYDYDDLITNTTPISVSASTWTKITNDGAGANTNLTYALPGVANVWDTSTQLFDFSDLANGDTIDIRMDLFVTTTQPNQEIKVELLLGVGGFSYSIQFVETDIKTAGMHNINRYNSIYLGDDNTRLNDGYFRMFTSDPATVLVNGWFCRANKRVV